MTVFWIDMPVCDEHFTVLRVRRNKDADWVEFRGDGYHRWTDFEPCTKSPAQVLHDSLLGWHSCILHAGDRAAICPHHDDFERVQELFLGAEI